MDYPEIVEAFDDELKADPYGAAMAMIREVLVGALNNAGSMNEGELQVLGSIADICIADANDDSWLPNR